MLGLTPDEKKVIVFFTVALVLGNALLLYKRKHPSFAPELKYGRPQLPAPTEYDSAGYADVGKVFPQNDGRSDKISTGKIDINRADRTELQRLPAIGPAMAKKIIDFRESSGGFRKVEDLMKVKGIGNKKFNKLREHVYVDH